MIYILKAIVTALVTQLTKESDYSLWEVIASWEHSYCKSNRYYQKYNRAYWANAGLGRVYYSIVLRNELILRNFYMTPMLWALLVDTEVLLVFIIEGTQ
ncbi:MAG: hypothetical protein ACE5R6_15765 [Candidatus Heimdallarchaeota archaeon]